MIPDIEGRAHNYFNVKNKTVNWTGTDTLDLFLENKKDKKLQESIKYYEKNPILYSHNKLGFRTPDEFNSIEYGNVFLGCSHTYGVGHHLKDSWAYQLNRELGGRFWNLGQGGAGMGCAYRLLSYYKTKLKISRVFLFVPHFHRYEIYIPEYNGWETLSINNKEYEKVLPYLASEYNANLYTTMGLDGIKHTCSEIGVELYTLTDWDFYNVEHPELHGIQARDSQHQPLSQTYSLFKHFYNEVIHREN